MSPHFRAFSFVDRITSVQPGVRIQGVYHIPAGLTGFSSSLVAEATGQLAAWSAMAAVDVLEMTLEEVKTSLNNTGRHVSMDAPLRDDGDSGTMMDVMSNPDLPSPLESLMTDSLRNEIERSLRALHTGREADVIRPYFGLNGNQPHTLEEIGQKFDLTRERVRQIKEKAIRRMKHTSRSSVLKAYLG